MPSVRFCARPSGNTSTSLAVKLGVARGGRPPTGPRALDRRLPHLRAAARWRRRARRALSTACSPRSPQGNTLGSHTPRRPRWARGLADRTRTGRAGPPIVPRAAGHTPGGRWPASPSHAGRSGQPARPVRVRSPTPRAHRGRRGLLQSQGVSLGTPTSARRWNSAATRCGTLPRPCAGDVAVVGPVRVILYAATSARDTDFTAKLVDVLPDGRAQNLTDGILRLRYRQSLEKPELARPGEIYKLTIDAGVTGNVFRKGHRIRIEVSSSNFPRFDRNPNTGGPIADRPSCARPRKRFITTRAARPTCFCRCCGIDFGPPGAVFFSNSPIRRGSQVVRKGLQNPYSSVRFRPAPPTETQVIIPNRLFAGDAPERGCRPRWNIDVTRSRVGCQGVCPL